MFGKRKPKEDDPLVPHGLIWHATAEPDTQQKLGPNLVEKGQPADRPPISEPVLRQPIPEPKPRPPAQAPNKKPDQKLSENEKEKKDPFGSTVQYAQVLEVARRARLAKQAGSPETPEQEPKSGASSIPWWRMQHSAPEPAPVAPKPIPFPAAAPEATSPNKAASSPFPIPANATSIREGGPFSKLPAPMDLPPRIGSGRGKPTSVSTPLAPGGDAVGTSRFGQAPEKGELPVIPISAPPVSPGNLLKYEQTAVTSSPRIGARLRLSGTGLWSATTFATARLCSSYSQALQGLKLHVQDRWIKGVHVNCVRAGERGKDLASVGMTRARDFAQNSRTTFKNILDSSLAHSQKFSRAKTPVASVTSSTSVGESQTPGVVKTKTSGWPGLRVRLSGLPLKTKILIARQLSIWEIGRDVPYNSRLLSSMTMAAIAALIALTILSLAPRYAAKSLPSRVLANGAATKSNSVAPAKIAAAPAMAKNTTAKTKTSQTQKAAAPNAATVRPKSRRRSDNDDYIAPDTYKYYGSSSSKASR